VEQQGWIVDGPLVKIEHEVVQFMQSRRLAYFGVWTIDMWPKWGLIEIHICSHD